MLSKHTFLPTKSLFMAAGIAACSLAAVQQSANALTITTTLGPTDYVYDISTDAETLTPGDTIEFSGLLAVTEVIAPTGFTGSAPGSTVTFTVDAGEIFLPGTALGSFTIKSPAVPGESGETIGFAATSLTTPILEGNIAGLPLRGPAAVPLEFSPGLGLILSGTLFGALKLRSKFSQKEEINF